MSKLNIINPKEELRKQDSRYLISTRPRTGNFGPAKTIRFFQLSGLILLIVFISIFIYTLLSR